MCGEATLVVRHEPLPRDSKSCMLRPVSSVSIIKSFMYQNHKQENNSSQLEPFTEKGVLRRRLFGDRLRSVTDADMDSLPDSPVGFAAPSNHRS